MKTPLILLIDAIINFVLGILLLLFSKKLTGILGIPPTDQYFYPNILGAVLVGIGFALLIEIRHGKGGLVGLGLGGAVAINLCGGIVLGLWLLTGNMDIPIHGYIFLWFLVFILIGISIVEMIAYRSRNQQFES